MNGSNAIIVFDKKILLFLRDDIPTIPNPNCWSLPGGLAEVGETPRQTVIRELVEEVSYAPDSLTHLGYLFNSANNARVDVFFARVDGDEAKKFIHNKGEGQKIEFIDFERLSKLKLTYDLKLYLTKYASQIKKVIENDSLIPNGSMFGLLNDL